MPFVWATFYILKWILGIAESAFKDLAFPVDMISDWLRRKSLAFAFLVPITYDGTEGRRR